MVTETERLAAPYAPVQHVLNIVRRFRERGLPDPLNLQELERLSVPAGNAPRTLVALRFLRLVDEDGSRTPEFERIGRASTDEYPAVLGEVVRAAYEPVFAVADPATDNEIAMHDAFRHHEPQGQRGRMIALFLGLCQEAGIVSGGPPQRRPRMRRASAERVVRRPSPQMIQPAAIESGEKVSEPTAMHAEGAVDYRLLSALIQQLPRDGRWTQERRDKWISALTANVDLMIEVTKEDQVKKED